MHNILIVSGVFLASLVEAVEALTIVLAVGTTRSWRAAWQGVAAGLLVLAAIVAVLGPALTVIPIGTLRLIVGFLLLAFGLQWLQKAILRSSGYKPLHDEEQIFKKQEKLATAAPKEPRSFVPDWYSFTVAFKGVLLEGLEVALIVVTFGAGQSSFLPAIAAAAAAVAVVVLAGLVVHRPLARVPENTLKFCVGVVLTSYGSFWGGEGAGVVWPGGDVAIIGLIALYAVVSVALAAWLRAARANLPKEAS